MMIRWVVLIILVFQFITSAQDVESYSRYYFPKIDVYGDPIDWSGKDPFGHTKRRLRGPGKIIRTINVNYLFKPTEFDLNHPYDVLPLDPDLWYFKYLKDVDLNAEESIFIHRDQVAITFFAALYKMYDDRRTEDGYGEINVFRVVKHPYGGSVTRGLSLPKSRGAYVFHVEIKDPDPVQKFEDNWRKFSDKKRNIRLLEDYVFRNVFPFIVLDVYSFLKKQLMYFRGPAFRGTGEFVVGARVPITSDEGWKMYQGARYLDVYYIIDLKTNFDVFDHYDLEGFARVIEKGVTVMTVDSRKRVVSGHRHLRVADIYNNQWFRKQLGLQLPY